MDTLKSSGGTTDEERNNCRLELPPNPNQVRFIRCPETGASIVSGVGPRIELPASTTAAINAKVRQLAQKS